jgi:hypothetical protein
VWNKKQLICVYLIRSVRQIQRSTSLYHERYKRLSITLSTNIVKVRDKGGQALRDKIVVAFSGSISALYLMAEVIEAPKARTIPAGDNAPGERIQSQSRAVSPFHDHRRMARAFSPYP